MSTRSSITVRTGENERKTIYCHLDGYPSYNGVMLLEHYNDHDKAKELVSNGDMSVLNANINPKNNTHSFDNREADVCVFYGRDRGETNVEPQTLTNAEETPQEEWNYYFDGKNWFVNSGEYNNQHPEKVLLTKEFCDIY